MPIGMSAERHGIGYGMCRPIAVLGVAQVLGINFRFPILGAMTNFSIAPGSTASQQASIWTSIVTSVFVCIKFGLWYFFGSFNLFLCFTLYVI